MRIANLSFCLLLSLAIASGAAALPNQNVVRVDCNAGGKVQAAVDANSAPFDIVISGICTENVVIRDKDVTLRGASGDPTLDGIRGRLPTTPALTVRGSVIATIRGLSFSNSAGQAVSIQAGANETLTSCRFENNGGIGLQVTSGALVTADSLTFNANTGRSIAVSTQSSLRSTNAARFARVLVTDGTVIQGAIQCTGAADAVLDGTVIIAQGSTITGCEHAPAPPP